MDRDFNSECSGKKVSSSYIQLKICSETRVSVRHQDSFLTSKTQICSGVNHVSSKKDFGELLKTWFEVWYEKDPGTSKRGSQPQPSAKLCYKMMYCNSNLGVYEQTKSQKPPARVFKMKSYKQECQNTVCGIKKASEPVFLLNINML